MFMVLMFLAVTAFLVLATTQFKLHPFFVLIIAAFLTAFAYGIPSDRIAKTIASGFGSTLGDIGLVIVLGTIVGVILEKSGAAITMADAVVRVLGDDSPTLTMTLIGYIVSVPIFCDSGFVILNSLKESLAKRLKISSVAMSVALATGLYATHTFVPPTPGPIAVAGNLGLESNLGLIIGFGIYVSAAAAVAGMLWANRFSDVAPDNETPLNDEAQDWNALKASYGRLPSSAQAFAPLFVPILLICLSSIATLPSLPFGAGVWFDLFTFLGQPLTALLIGLLLSLRLLKSVEEFSTRINQGITTAAPILLITGAGGAFGATLKALPLTDYLDRTLSSLDVGIFIPFIVAVALKSIQGSSTVALVTASALVAPLLEQLGLASDVGRVLTALAIGAGAMIVSHANDSYFWVVSQGSRMRVGLAYRALTIATLIQGVTAMTLVYLLSLMLL
ncbi:GntP family permease [Vibrio coralliilyticus]|uniref:GntP family permease n=1 Tax=Vibrio coralliilyticus TaxID=190893 RepID=UPI00179A8F19|nr:GntP family permease [Vibrio coralliilyticus]NUW67111.1 GntP family permease [Vibrio coralliilyticus]